MTSICGETEESLTSHFRSAGLSGHVVGKCWHTNPCVSDFMEYEIHPTEQLLHQMTEFISSIDNSII